MNAKVEWGYDSTTKQVLVDNNCLIDFKNLLSGCRINFLLGAGFSANVLGVLDNREIVLDSLKRVKTSSDEEEKKRDILTAYVYWDYFVKSICKIGIIDNNAPVMNDYYAFSDNIYQVLSDRSNPVMNKQANIFTTNYDPIAEIAFESAKTICNDGFEGRIEPKFSTSNYSVSFFREAFYSNRRAEVPSVNIFKIHGSVSWNKNDKDEIVYTDYKDKIKAFNNKFGTVFDVSCLAYINGNLSSNDEADIENKIGLLIKSGYLDHLICNHGEYRDFLDTYHKTFLIVNPTKEKFSDTLLNRNYYELLRMFSNEMEKENSLLIAIGFSFKDEHILDLLKRSLVNPSLKVIVFCHKATDISEFEEKFKDVKTNGITYIYLENGNYLSVAEINQILGKIHI